MQGDSEVGHDTRYRVAVSLYGDRVATIEYRCPTHGKVEPADEGAAVPVCPLTLRKTIGGMVVVERCEQRLTAYTE